MQQSKTQTATIMQPQIPLMQSCVYAGFPNPASEFIEHFLDLNQYLIKHPAATFFIRVEGDSMIGADISSGDILVVDRSLEATDRQIVIACIDGEFTVKRLMKRNGTTWLEAENARYRPIHIRSNQQFEVWGVVTYVIHKTSNHHL